MTRREYKALLELKRWIVAAIPNHKEAVRLIEALEPLCRGIHTGDKGEVSALRLDEIDDTEEALRERLNNMLNTTAVPTAGRYRELAPLLKLVDRIEGTATTEAFSFGRL